MSAILVNSFNENDTANVRDYSNSIEHAATVAGLATVADGNLFGLDMDGSTSQYTVSNLSFASAFSIFIDFNPDTIASGQTLYSRTDNSFIFFTGSRVRFRIFDGVTAHTTDLVVSAGTRYSLLATYSNTNGSALYVDTFDNSDTDANTLTLDDTNDVYVGSNVGANFGNAKIYNFKIWDEEITDQDIIQDILDNPNGLPATVGANTFAAGDLIQDFQFGFKGTITGTDGADDLFYIKHTTVPWIENAFAQRIGHRWDATRQHFLRDKSTVDDFKFNVFNNVSTHADIDSDTKASSVIDKDGLRLEGNTHTANVTIEAKDHYVFCNSSGGAFTVTLPASPNNFERHTIKDSNGSANAGGKKITIAGNGKNIDGAANSSIQTSYGSKTVVYNGTSWSIV